MSSEPHTILCVFAHPDDEIGAGSTLAYYDDRGVRSILICASRGEACTIFCDDCATPETIADVRTGELECACAHLGIDELRWLDWPDGAISGLPRDAAVGEIVRHIREVRPDIIITHPEHGLYPHPDHLAIWEMTREAFSAAADPERYPEAGAAWAPARLFVRALPQSMFDAAPALADFRVELNGSQLPFHGTPDDQIDVVMEATAHVPRRMAAWDCHKSQHNPKGFSSVMPDGLRQEMAAREAFVLAAERVPLPDGVKDDLLAGLDEPSGETEANEEQVKALRQELVAGRTTLALAEYYRKNAIEPVDRQAFKRFIERQQEILQELARALRQAGAGSGKVEADSLGKVERLEIPKEQRAYLRGEVTRAAERYRALATADPPRRSMWEDLAALSADQLAGLG
jgi:LmbE family N-acetylglucosaminyl deacetylase